jgi:hypothetical protein
MTEPQRVFQAQKQSPNNFNSCRCHDHSGTRTQDHGRRQLCLGVKPNFVRAWQQLRPFCSCWLFVVCSGPRGPYMQYSSTALAAASAAVDDGVPVNEAACTEKVPRSTLQRQSKAGVAGKPRSSTCLLLLKRNWFTCCKFTCTSQTTQQNITYKVNLTPFFFVLPLTATAV